MTAIPTSDQPYALQKNQGQHFDFGMDFIVKASEIREGSGAALLVYETRAGEEPEAHAHPTEDEMFYVLDGAITFFCGGEQFDLEKDGFIFLPHGKPHSYRIHGDDPVRLDAVDGAEDTTVDPHGEAGYRGGANGRDGALVGRERQRRVGTYVCDLHRATEGRGIGVDRKGTGGVVAVDRSVGVDTPVVGAVDQQTS